jgi:hypothetical protein
MFTQVMTAIGEVFCSTCYICHQTLHFWGISVQIVDATNYAKRSCNYENMDDVRILYFATLTVVTA